MKQNKQEINKNFEELPEIEIGEFMIFHDGILDRRALIAARMRRFASNMGNVAYRGAEAILGGVDALFEEIDTNLEGKHVFK